MYNPYKTYAQNRQPSDLTASNFNAFAYSSNFTLECDNYAGVDVSFNSTSIHFEWFTETYATHDPNGTVFIARHREIIYWIFPIHHDLESSEAIAGDIHVGGNGGFDGFSNSWLMRFYDNTTDTSTFSIRCSHISLRLSMSSESASYTFPEALRNKALIHVAVDWSYDFTQMGINVWSLLGTILSFQTIKTGIAILDAVLNSIVSIPLWVAIAYLAYRFITGLIPFLSGGGGD